MKITSTLFCFCLLLVAAHLAAAQTPVDFKVNLLVSEGKKAKRKEAILKFSENAVAWQNRKNKAVIKEFNYAEIVEAEYSFSEKPFLSERKMNLAINVFGELALPLLFLKKKEHWLSVRTADDFLVIRLNRKSYQKVLDEFKSHKIAVKNLGDEDFPYRN